MHFKLLLKYLCCVKLDYHTPDNLFVSLQDVLVFSWVGTCTLQYLACAEERDGTRTGGDGGIHCGYGMQLCKHAF